MNQRDDNTDHTATPDFDNLMNPANIHDPFPLYHWLRVHSPVHWNRYLGSWLLTRFDDVRSAFGDPTRFSSDSGEPLLKKADGLPASAKASFDIGYRFFYQQIQTFDPPAHTAQRALIAKAFTPRVMENMRSSIQVRVDRLLDRLEEAGSGDFISQFAYPLPSLVIFDLLGFGEEYYEPLRASAAAFARFPPALHARDSGSLEAIAENLTRTERLLQNLISERRAHPRNDLLSALATARDGSTALTDGELVVLCNFLLFAGHETTANLLGGSILHLLQNRSLWNQLKNSPELLGNAVEELLRFVSPVLTVARILKEDFECHGTVLRKGERISLMIGAANHDPAQFENPDQLDLERAKPQSIAFGNGIHYCIGAALARMEAQIALSALLRRFPEMRLASSAVEYQPVFFLRALKSLPVCAA